MSFLFKLFVVFITFTLWVGANIAIVVITYTIESTFQAYGIMTERASSQITILKEASLILTFISAYGLYHFVDRRFEERRCTANISRGMPGTAPVELED